MLLKYGEENGNGVTSQFCGKLFKWKRLKLCKNNSFTKLQKY